MKIITRQEAIEQGLKRYYTGKPCKRGHYSERYFTKGCVECAKVVNAELHKSNPQRRRNHSATPSGFAVNNLARCKRRSKKKNRPFDLTKEWILEKLENGHCELSGIKFDMTIGDKNAFRNPFKPSIDRKNSSKGYTKKNCRMILSILNGALGEYGDEVFEKVAIAYVKNLKKKKK